MFLKIKTTIRLSRFLVFLPLLIVSCSPQQLTNLSPTPTFSRFLPPTWTPTTTATPTETRTLTSLPTAYPTNTPTPSFSYVPPIEPTLIDSEAGQILFSMLNRNGSCQLPCWWGIVPGKTKLDDARTALYSFVGRIEELHYTDISSDNATHQFTISAVYYQRDESSDAFEIRSIDGVVESISAYADSTQRYGLSNILTEFGRPTDVYINTTFASPTGEVPFSLVIYYEENGIMAFYHHDAPIINERIYFCNKRNSPEWLHVWNPLTSANEQKKKAFLDGLDYWTYASGFHSILDTSNLTLEQFYISFKDSNSEACLITSANTWSILPTPTYIFPTPTFIFPTVTPLPASQ